MLNLNRQQLENVAVAAIDKVGERGGKDAKRWVNAIVRAMVQLEENPYISDDGDGLLILSPTSNEIYHANGSCQCEAWNKGKFPCWHRAANRLYRMYVERSH